MIRYHGAHSTDVSEKVMGGRSTKFIRSVSQTQVIYFFLSSFGHWESGSDCLKMRRKYLLSEGADGNCPRHSVIFVGVGKTGEGRKGRG